MSRFVRVDPQTLDVTLMYNTEAGAKWDEGDIPCEVGFDVIASQAVRADDGTITLVEDPIKVAQKIEQAWTNLRTKRNALLTASDWTVLPYSPLTESQIAAWVEYRTALRNLPSTVTDPTNVTWPPKP